MEEDLFEKRQDMQKIVEGEGKDGDGLLAELEACSLEKGAHRDQRRSRLRVEDHGGGG